MREIPFSPPDISEAEINAVAEVMRSGWITTGPKTKTFEKEIAEYCKTPRAVCLNSATAALEMTLRLLGIGEGDEVITSAYTYTASASVIQHIGATIVLADVAEGSFEMDYDAVENLITEKTKAVIPVDIGGVMCDYDKIFEIAERKKHLFRPSNEIQEKMGRVFIVADGAHSFGSERKGLKSGNVADFTSFSFHAVKNLTTAEGGAVTWRHIEGVDDEELYRGYMLLSLHGQSKDALAKTKAGAWEYDIVSPAFKCNMTDIMAAIGRVQLERYPDILATRRQIIEIYDNAMDKLDVEYLHHYGDDFSSDGHLYLVRLNGKDATFRNEIITKMVERGVATNVHYKPLPMHTAYKNLGFDIKDYPNALRQFENEISLPLNSKMSVEDAMYVAEVFADILKN